MKYVLIIILSWGWGMIARSQNSIDRLMEQHSAIGEITFTSAVERDPSTRQVIKVVKVLKDAHGSAHAFQQAFKQELRKQQNSRIELSAEENSYMLYTENEKETRIYRLKSNTRYGRGYEVTVIIKYNRKQ